MSTEKFTAREQYAISLLTKAGLSQSVAESILPSLQQLADAGSKEECEKIFIAYWKRNAVES